MIISDKIKEEVPVWEELLAEARNTQECGVNLMDLTVEELAILLLKERRNTETLAARCVKSGHMGI